MTFVPSESAFAPQFNLGSDRDDEASMGEEIVLSECPHTGERACSVFRRLAAELEKRHATCVALFVYGHVASAETEEALWPKAKVADARNAATIIGRERPAGMGVEAI